MENEETEKTLELCTINPVERKKGRPRKENKCKIVPISLPADLIEKINIECGNNRSAFIANILNQHFNTKEAILDYKNE